MHRVVEFALRQRVFLVVLLPLVLIAAACSPSGS